MDQVLLNPASPTLRVEPRYDRPIKMHWQISLNIRRIAPSNYAPVAQLDRVLGYEPSGREFESLQARHP